MFCYNDSIATTPIATIAAMQTVDLSKTTLLIGGYDRGNDWKVFADAINNNPPNLLLISGQNGLAIFEHLKLIGSNIDYKLCNDLADAINYAQIHSQIGDTVLLSPGAPSFDQFDSYIKRGEFFSSEMKKYAI